MPKDKDEITMSAGTVVDCERCERPLIDSLCGDNCHPHTHQLYCAIRNDYNHQHAVMGEPCYCSKTIAVPSSAIDTINLYGSTNARDVKPDVNNEPCATTVAHTSTDYTL